MQIRDGESDGPVRRALAGAVMTLMVVAACSGNDAAPTDTAPPVAAITTTTTADAATIEFTAGDEDGTLFPLPIDVSAVPIAIGE